MTLPNGSNKPPISLSDINAEFSRGSNMSAYRGTRWFMDNNSRGYFPSGTINFSDFYSKRVSSPVVSGSATINSSQNFTIPMFNNFYVTAVSGQGGQGGQNGNCASGGAGGNSGGSSLQDYVGSPGGGGGAPGGNWGSQPSASTSVSINDSNQASVIAQYYATKYASIGGGGGGGAQGFYARSQFICVSYVYYFGVPVCNGGYTAYYCDQGAGGGGAGANGYISLSWN